MAHYIFGRAKLRMMMMMMRTMFSSRNVLLAGKKNLAHLKWEAAVSAQPNSAQLLLPTAMNWEEHAALHSRARAWNGREHGVWEQREMKRMIANIVLNDYRETDRQIDVRTKWTNSRQTKTAAKSHQGNGCISNAWNMAKEFTISALNSEQNEYALA